jgi:hypothetical protein
MTHAARDPVLPDRNDAAAAPAAGSPPVWKTVLAPLALAALVWTAAYVLLAVPGKTFSSAPTQRFSGSQLSITRGAGFTDGNRFVVRATDPSGIAVITVDTPNIRAADYRRIRWRAVSVDPEATVMALWRSDSSPGKTLTIPLEQYEEGVYVALPTPPEWSGRIEAVALTIRGTLRQPMFIEDVTIDPLDARDVLADRARDWFGFRHWSGLSINTAIGGPLEQPVWLPIAATIIAFSAVAWILVRGRRRMSRQAMRIAITLVIGFTWVLLDARWLWLRAQQTLVTAGTFSGKTLREKHIADIDGYVYSFAEQVRARLPKAPARIYVAADDHYFGGRLAYHLYPHNAYMDHHQGALPPPEKCKPGEYIIVFRRRGVQYDPVQQTLSWDKQAAVPVEILIAHQGNAAFRIR